MLYQHRIYARKHVNIVKHFMLCIIGISVLMFKEIIREKYKYMFEKFFVYLRLSHLARW